MRETIIHAPLFAFRAALPEPLDGRVARRHRAAPTYPADMSVRAWTGSGRYVCRAAWGNKHHQLYLAGACNLSHAAHVVTWRCALCPNCLPNTKLATKLEQSYFAYHPFFPFFDVWVCLTAGRICVVLWGKPHRLPSRCLGVDSRWLLGCLCSLPFVSAR